MTVQFLASKWLHVDFLLSYSEMQRLIAALTQEHGPLLFFSTLGVQKIGENQITEPALLKAFQDYEEMIKSGSSLQEGPFRFYFTSCITKEKAAIIKTPIGSDRESVSPQKPCLQMQPHRFSYSKLDKKFRSMVLGKNSVSWGVRISYPQLYQIPNTRAVEDALDEALFPNAALFSSLRRWIRHNTIATPMLVDGKRVNIPIRIGKECLPWINAHQELGQLQVVKL
jgi:hypothetical protein